MTSTKPTTGAATGAAGEVTTEAASGGPGGPALPPVVKTRIVPLAPEAAFDLFTTRMGEWWPTASHSIAGGDAHDDVVEIVFEPGVGGRVLEVTERGDQHAWADVMAWEPPHRFVLAWHPSPAPVAASDLEVTFTATDDGTEVRLVHTGWERFGDRADELRRDYDGGWDHVLAPYVGAAT